MRLGILTVKTSSLGFFSIETHSLNQIIKWIKVHVHVRVCEFTYLYFAGEMNPLLSALLDPPRMQARKNCESRQGKEVCIKKRQNKKVYDCDIKGNTSRTQKPYYVFRWDLSHKTVPIFEERILHCLFHDTFQETTLIAAHYSSFLSVTVTKNSS